MSSIDLKSKSNSRIGLSCVSIYDSLESGRPVGCLFGDSCLFPLTAGTMNKVVVHEPDEDSDSCSSSSIGRNSDISGGSSAGEVDSGDGEGEGEVQSSYKGPLDGLDALEEVLPIKRGISKFYCGKSKSFTSLGDASSCSSITDIAKPEDSYTRKRKNLLAFNTYFDKNHTNCLTTTTNNNNNNNISGNGISKRPANSRSTLSLAMTMTMTMAMACSESTTTDNSESSNSDSSSPNPCLPPLHPHSRRLTNTESVAPSSSSSSPSRHKTSPYRSFSLSDLQGASASTIPRITGLVPNNGGGNDEDKPCLLLT